jgi:hypothetical protein
MVQNDRGLYEQNLSLPLTRNYFAGSSAKRKSAGKLLWPVFTAFGGGGGAASPSPVE